MDFLIGNELASAFKKKPSKLEKLDLGIPGVKFYSESKIFKEKEVVLSDIAIKSLKGINFLYNYMVNDPEKGDLQYQIDRFIKRQKHNKF